MSYVYLKLQSNTNNSDTVNVIPLKANSVSISVSKTIPSFAIPLSGVATGESITAALDLGMAQKTISVQGVILDQQIKKTHEGATTNVIFTAHEIAQLIASGVDSTGFAKNQAFNELVVLIPSFVDSNYVQRTGVLSSTTIVSGDSRDEGTLVPFNFASRGTEGFGDNLGVAYRGSAFPTSSTSTGMTGFIRSFSFNMEAEAIDISFSMQFEVAIIGP